MVETFFKDCRSIFSAIYSRNYFFILQNIYLIIYSVCSLFFIVQRKNLREFCSHQLYILFIFKLFPYVDLLFASWFLDVKQWSAHAKYSLIKSVWTKTDLLQRNSDASKLDTSLYKILTLPIQFASAAQLRGFICIDRVKVLVINIRFSLS